MITRIIPPAWFLLALVLMYSAHRYLPLAEVLPSPLNFSGLAPMFAGLLLAAIAVNEFRKAKTSFRSFERSTALVTSGPFRFTRNPMYLGLTLALCGTAMLLGSLTPWLAVPVFFWVMHTRFVAREERIMAETFGEAYTDYRERVRRWL